MAEKQMRFTRIIRTIAMFAVVAVAWGLGRSTAPDTLPIEPAIAMASPQAEKASDKREGPTEVSAWQQLAYVSVLSRRMAQECYALEQKLKEDGGDWSMVSVSSDSIAKWYEPNPCELTPWPPCVTKVKYFAMCDSMTFSGVERILMNKSIGLKLAVKRLGPDATIQYQGSPVYIPDEKWLKPRDYESRSQ